MTTVLCITIALIINAAVWAAIDLERMDDDVHCRTANEPQDCPLITHTFALAQTAQTDSAQAPTSPETHTA
jgi:hypothetical protein